MARCRRALLSPLPFRHRLATQGSIVSAHAGEPGRGRLSRCKVALVRKERVFFDAGSTVRNRLRYSRSHGLAGIHKADQRALNTEMKASLAAGNSERGLTDQSSAAQPSLQSHGPLDADHIRHPRQTHPQR